jgi:hypothetical protein
VTSTTLPTGDAPFGGRISRLATDSTAARPQIATPPAGAPNVVVVLLDDVGFGAQGTFGGPVPTPVLDRIAATVSDSRPKSGAAIAAASKPVSASARWPMR